MFLVLITLMLSMLWLPIRAEKIDSIPKVMYFDSDLRIKNVKPSDDEYPMISTQTYTWKTSPTFGGKFNITKITAFFHFIPNPGKEMMASAELKSLTLPYGYYAVGQSFKLSEQCNVSGIALHLNKIKTDAGNIVVELRESANGPAITNAVFESSKIWTKNWYYFDFSKEIQLKANKEYYIATSKESWGTDYNLYYDNDTYDNGTMYSSYTSSDLQRDPTHDIAFRIYVKPTPKITINMTLGKHSEEKIIDVAQEKTYIHVFDFSSVVSKGQSMYISLTPDAGQGGYVNMSIGGKDASYIQIMCNAYNIIYVKTYSNDAEKNIFNVSEKVEIRAFIADIFGNESISSAIVNISLHNEVILEKEMNLIDSEIYSKVFNITFLPKANGTYNIKVLSIDTTGNSFENSTDIYVGWTIYISEGVTNTGFPGEKVLFEHDIITGGIADIYVKTENGYRVEVIIDDVLVAIDENGDGDYDDLNDKALKDENSNGAPDTIGQSTLKINVTIPLTEKAYHAEKILITLLSGGVSMNTTDILTVMPNVSCKLDGPKDVSGTPGNFTSINHTLTNTGNIEDTYDIYVKCSERWRTMIYLTNGTEELIRIGDDDNGDGTFEYVYVDNNEDGLPDIYLQSLSSCIITIDVYIPFNEKKGKTAEIEVEITSQTGKNIRQKVIDRIVVGVGGNPPSISSARIEPKECYADTTLRAVAEGWYDKDGDEEGYKYVWYVNGKEVSYNETLGQGNFSKNDRVRVMIIPFDGFLEGKGVISEEVIIKNSPPSIDKVKVSPLTVRAGDSLTMEPCGWKDIDGDSEGYEYVWIKNGIEVGHEKTFSGEIRHDDVIVAGARPYDGFDYGKWIYSDKIIVSNTPPVINYAYIKENVVRNGDTVTVGISATDPDNDDIDYACKWFLNGKFIGVGKAITLEGVKEGDELEAEVTPFDGIDQGKPVMTNKVIISAPEKKVSILSIPSIILITFLILMIILTAISAYYSTKDEAPPKYSK